MANHDFLIAYSDEIESWLRSEGCSVPKARQGNCWPTMEEVVRAVESEQLIAEVDRDCIHVLPPEDAPAALKGMTRTVKFMEVQAGKVVESPHRAPLDRLVLIECHNWEELNVDPRRSITMRGNFPLELFLTQQLTECCGQLLLYPDTGDPPIVLEPGDDVEVFATAWLESVKAEESWADYYRRIQSRKDQR